MPVEENKTASLGQRIRARREARKLGIDEVARSLHVPSRMVEAIENDEYEYFSAKVYALGVLKKMFQVLSMENPEELIHEYSTEWDIRNYHTKRELKPLPQNRGARPFLTPKRLWAGITLIVLVLLIIFIGLRFFDFVRAPSFLLETPVAKAQVIRDRILPIKGTIEREGSLTVNGREITIDEDGRFSGAIELRTGLNILQFLAENRFGKITSDTRYILVQ